MKILLLLLGEKLSWLEVKCCGNFYTQKQNLLIRNACDKNDQDTARNLIGHKPIIHCTDKLIENWNKGCFVLSLCYQSNRVHFLGFTGITTHLEYWKNMRKVCKSLPSSLLITKFSINLPIFFVGYYADKLIESAVYCLVSI